MDERLRWKGRRRGRQYEAKRGSTKGAALDAAEAKRLVIGHTPQTTGVTSGVSGGWRVDVGASSGIYGRRWRFSRWAPGDLA